MFFTFEILIKLTIFTMNLFPLLPPFSLENKQAGFYFHSLFYTKIIVVNKYNNLPNIGNRKSTVRLLEKASSAFERLQVPESTGRDVRIGKSDNHCNYFSHWSLRRTGY